MDTPFTKAARRGWAFIPVPITLARISPVPNDSAYFRAIGPITEADPASAKPKPSRIDFLPSSITSAGMSSYFELTINSAADAGEAATRRLVSASAEAASEVLNKSRRFMSDVLDSFQDSILCSAQKWRDGISVNARDVFHSDFFADVRGQLVKQKNRLLPPLIRVLRLRIMLVAADDEAIRKIRE